MTQTQATLLTTSTDLASRLPQSPSEPTIVSQTVGIVRYTDRQLTVHFGCGHDQLRLGAVKGFLSERFQTSHARDWDGHVTSRCIWPVRLEHGFDRVRADGKAFPMNVGLRRPENNGQPPTSACRADLTGQAHWEPGPRGTCEGGERIDQAGSDLFTPSTHEPERTSQAVIPRACAPLRQCQPRRVVLIVNHPGLRDAMCMLLRVEGYEVITVASLEEAHHALREGVDVLLTDHYLHNGQNGEQLIAQLRRDLRVCIKAVLMTWSTSAMAGAIRGDPDLRVVSNPLYPETLLRLVRELTTDEHPPLS